MKQINEETYYEILEVSPKATSREIQRAYEHAKETFQSNSSAIYSLFTEPEVREIQAVIEEAYRVLMDEKLRKEYDRDNSRALRADTWEGGSEGQETAGKPISLTFSGLVLDAVEEVYRGRALKQIRERMGIDLKTVSKGTRVNVKILEWIEDEAVENLPAEVYLKGFLKAYAVNLGLDPQRVIEGYLGFIGESKRR